MLVNDEPWCDVCANRVVESARPRLGRGLAAAVVTWGPLSLLWLVIFVGLHRMFVGWMAITYGASALFIWNQISPVRGAEPPRVARRER